jgi:O-antigen/teichoic acid export membrane protein
VPRRKLFLSGVASSYGVIGINIFYSGLSVPLALHYLDKEEFAIWALVVQITTYLNLIDFGLSGSLSRFLADYKSDVDGGMYGSVLRTGNRVFLLQGILLALLGAWIALFSAPLLQIPFPLRPTFTLLLLFQSSLVGLALASRTLSSPLWAHQRTDVSNLSAALNLLVGLILMWVGFTTGCGVFSYLWGSIAGWVVGTISTVIMCSKLHLYPSRGHWGSYNPALFRSMLSYGKDLFIMSLGYQLAFASQILVVTRTLGLEAATTWAISTKIFTLAQQAISKIFESSVGALAEFYVQGNRTKLSARFHGVLTLTSALAATLSSGLIMINSSFISLWTGGLISWPQANSVCLGVFLFFSSISRAHGAFVGVTKDVGGMKWCYFIEGFLFLSLSFLLAPHYGFIAILLSSLFANLSCTFVYGLHRSARFLNLSFGTLVFWSLPAGLVSIFTLSIYFAILWILPLSTSFAIQALLGAGLLLCIFLPLLWFFALSHSVRKETLDFLRRSISSDRGT